MTAEDELLWPWFEHMVASLPEVELFDVHAHIGHNDPDGFTMAEQELVDRLAAARSRSLVAPMHEPDGYPAANDAVIDAAARSDGRLVALCRLDPAKEPLGELQRCLDAGAAGVKLHPRAEGFELLEADAILAVAHERRLPVLVHAGRGIPTLGRDALILATRYPEARIILAHAAICDLNWLWRDLPRHRNLYIDTSWWNPTDLAALIALVAPGQLLYATDLPYFSPFMIATMVTRYAYQLGLGDEQVAGILGAQAERILSGGEPLDLGPPPGQAGLDYDIRLERLATMLQLAIARMLMGRTGWEPLSLARLACDLGDPEAPESDVTRNVLALLERQERLAAHDRDCCKPFGPGIRLVMLAACVARTPDVTLPRVPALEDPVALRAASAAGHRVREETASSGADHLVLDSPASST
jgi:predicted TIM-barrel fold metal-dependent hydrolase